MCATAVPPQVPRKHEKNNKNKRETRALLLVEIRNCFKRAVPFNSEKKTRKEIEESVLSPTHVINF